MLFLPRVKIRRDLKDSKIYFSRNVASKMKNNTKCGLNSQAQ